VWSLRYLVTEITVGTRTWLPVHALTACSSRVWNTDWLKNRGRRWRKEHALSTLWTVLYHVVFHSPSTRARYRSNARSEQPTGRRNPCRARATSLPVTTGTIARHCAVDAPPCVLRTSAGHSSYINRTSANGKEEYVTDGPDRPGRPADRSIARGPRVALADGRREIFTGRLRVADDVGGNDVDGDNVHHNHRPRSSCCGGMTRKMKDIARCVFCTSSCCKQYTVHRTAVGLAATAAAAAGRLAASVWPATARSANAYWRHQAP